MSDSTSTTPFRPALLVLGVAAAILLSVAAAGAAFHLTSMLLAPARTPTPRAVVAAVDDAPAASCARPTMLLISAHAAPDADAMLTGTRTGLYVQQACSSVGTDLVTA